MISRRALRVDTEWSEYDGDWIYVDWKIVPMGEGRATDGGDGKGPGHFDRKAIAEPGDDSGSGEDSTEQSTVRHYLPTIAQAYPGIDGAWDETAYYHGNQIGSTRLMTDGAGTVVRDLAYTAFGEEVDPGGEVGTRHRYAGKGGYESHDYFPFYTLARDGTPPNPAASSKETRSIFVADCIYMGM